MRFFYVAPLFLALSVNSVTAEELTPLNHFIIVDQGDGLMATIPASGEKALLNRLTLYQSDLIKQKSDLAAQLEMKKFDVKDALITIIMPGGLIYAAARKQQHNQAKMDLQEISNQLAELQTDMHQLSLKSGMHAIAMLE